MRRRGLDDDRKRSRRRRERMIRVSMFVCCVHFLVDIGIYKTLYGVKVVCASLQPYVVLRWFVPPSLLQS